MFAKDLTVSVLLDFYRELLSARQYDALALYYNDDLSLSEIAEHLGISRQGVRHIIKRSEDALRGYEDGLGLARRYFRSRAAASEITRRVFALRDRIADPGLREELDEIIRLATGLTEDIP